MSTNTTTHTQPRIGDLLTLHTGERAAVYRVQQLAATVPYFPPMWMLSVVTADGKKSEIYI